ncbi:unnamed protein product [Calypogeia fissa]
MELCIPVDRMALNGRCACGAKSELLGRNVNLRGPRFHPFGADIDRISRKRLEAALNSDHLVKAKDRKVGPRERRQLAMRAQSTFASSREHITKVQSSFAFKESAGLESRNWEKNLQYCKLRFMPAAAAAAAACLSWTLCSSAVASPITIDGTVQMPTTPVSENLRTYVETQLRRELQAQIKVQKDWLDEIGQPLSEWTIDDHVRRTLEERFRSRLDESGKPVSKLEIRESEVVPIFKPPVIASKKDNVANVGIAASSTREENSVSTTTPQSVNPTLERATELVAVAALPLGPVVSAASRTVGSAASMAAIEASGTVAAAAVPGVSLFARIISHFGGGGVAGAMGATLVYPLDTIKTRMQAQSDEEGEEANYKDELDCLRQVVTKEGIGSLYSGLVPQLIGIAPEKAMKLTVNEILMEMLECQMPGVGPWALELIAGGGGGFSQVVFTNPMEIVKVRLQTQAKDAKQKNSWDVIKELGVRGLYNGSAMTLARDIPSSAIFFAMYTLIRQVYPDQSFVAGFVAAIPATVLVTPFDVVKTRLQMERAAGEVPYENGYACFVTILQKEGAGALFKGSFARVLKTSPQFGITLMLYNLLCGG